MLRTRRPTTVALVSVLTIGVLSSCSGGGSGRSPQQRAAQRFLSAVAAGNAQAAADLTDAPTAARPVLAASVAGLGLGPTAAATLTATSAHTTGRRSSVGFRAALTIHGVGSPWHYTGRVTLSLSGGHWRVHWAPTDLHPDLPAGSHLVAVRTQPARAPLEDSAGRPLFAPAPVVRVGIEPKLVRDLPGLARTLAGVAPLQSTAAEIQKDVRAAAHPTDFVPVATLRRSAYETVRGRIHDLDGTVFQTDTELLPPTSHFGEPLLGTVGPATADVVKAAHGRVAASDQTGLGGLQQALDSRLAGRPGVSIAVAGADGTPTRTLARLSGPVSGTPVRLTLDRSTQQAADAVMSTLPQAGSLVAVDRTTGRVLADANSPSVTYDYGLAGAFPPGSTFKIATWTAAFTVDRNLTPGTRVDCPATFTVDGRHFVNENKFAYPPIPVSSAFGYSCNTSAIKEAMTLPSNAVVDAARALGLGGKWSLPVPAFTGSMPPPATTTERAADAIGQGRVLASPLLMALMAGAASTGVPVRPSLLAGRAVRRGTTLPVPPAELRTLMRATVELPAGTGHVLADLPAVIGKTGTAEYGNATPPRSHCWFAGVQGNVAFAVFVYDGASQHVDPAKLAHRFLAGLPQR